jgi:hypothetical protein
MRNFHLTPRGDRWELREERGTTIATYDNKAAAIQSSRRTVKRETGSLKIHKADGTIEEERTHPRSIDPKTSPG